MNSNAARNALVAVLSAVIGALLIAAGFLAAVIVFDDGDEVATPAAVAEVTATPVADTPPTPDTSVVDGGVDIHAGIFEEIVDILAEDFVEPERIDRQYLLEGAIGRHLHRAQRPALHLHRPADVRRLAQRLLRRLPGHRRDDRAAGQLRRDRDAAARHACRARRHPVRRHHPRGRRRLGRGLERGEGGAAHPRPHRHHRRAARPARRRQQRN